MSIPPLDEAVVEAQLGRAPRSIHAVGHRCPCGLPDVVTTEPRLHDGVADAELIKGLDEQRCLGCCSPDPCAGSLTVSKAWPVEANNAVAGRKMVHESADNKILNQRAVAMEQHHAGSCTITALEVVETHPVTLNEVANWWVLSLSHE